MPKLNKSQILAAAYCDLCDRLARSLPRPEDDDDAAVDPFLDAEMLIDAYLKAVDSRSSQLPAGSDLALACAHVLVATRVLTRADLDTLTRLNAPALGAPLFEFAPLVADMKRRAVAALQAMATAPQAALPAQGHSLL